MILAWFRLINSFKVLKSDRGALQSILGQMYEEQDQYLQDRSKAMEQVESTIVELGDMFVQLAGMVKGKSTFIQPPLNPFF